MDEAPLLLQLVGDPVEEEGRGQAEEGGDDGEEPDEAIAPRGVQLGRDLAALVEELQQALRVSSLQGLDEARPLGVTGGLEPGELLLQPIHPLCGVDRQPGAGQGHGKADGEDLAGEHALDCTVTAGRIPRGNHMAKPYDPKDVYYRRARKEGLRARSAFKIEEILKKHQLLGPGRAVLALGAAPG